MSEVEIRPARPEEFAEIGEVTLEAYRSDGFLDGTEASYADKLRDTAARSRTGELLAAVDASGTVLGSVTVVRPGTEWAEISREGELEFRMLAVTPAARGRGVGEALTHAVLERARELGSARVVLSSLDSMTAAHRLYERLGFTRLPERDWRPEPRVRLIAYALALES
jgi:ribosomal protein S18 acetylase RimI-like enzyme